MSEVVEQVAQRLFDQQPHKHPRGNVPDWNKQPDHIKQVFRRIADEIVP